MMKDRSSQTLCAFKFSFKFHNPVPRCIQNVKNLMSILIISECHRYPIQLERIGAL